MAVSKRKYGGIIMLLSKSQYEEKFAKQWAEDIDPKLVDLLDSTFAYYQLDQIDKDNMGMVLIPKYDNMNPISITIHRNEDGTFTPEDSDIIEFIENGIAESK